MRHLLRKSAAVFPRPKLPFISLRLLSSSSVKRQETESFAAPDDHYDVVVSGGGMVGFAAACVLGKWVGVIINGLGHYDKF